MTYESTTSSIISAPVSTVWDAFTLPEQVKEWFFGTNQVTDWKLGSPIFFRGEWEGKPYEDKGTVLEYIPQKSLSYNYWSSLAKLEDKPELYQVVKYDLEEVPEGTKLTITQSNVQTQESADHSSENWKAMLDILDKWLVARA
jgi:uncharacterized protein YndB with AHSA1/START domain